MMILALTTATESSGFNIIEFINKYQDWLGILSLLIVFLIVYLVHYVKTKIFSNTSKTKKVDLNKVKQVPSQDLVGIDDIGHNMYIDSQSETYTSVIGTVGIPYSIYSEQEKDSVNAGYINFLNSINFPFSKHIVSRKIDIETTDEIYMNAYKRRYAEFEEIEEQRRLLEKEIVELDEDDELVKKYYKLVQKKNLLQSSLDYLQEQIEYIDNTTSKIEGSTKSVYYATSASLDSEALKGLELSEQIFAYSNNVGDRTAAMINALSGAGVRAFRLNDVDLLDLARAEYKPYSSNVFKTKHLVNQANLDNNVSLNIDIYGRFKLHEALEKAREDSNVTENQ